MLAVVFLGYLWTFGIADRRPRALTTGISAAWTVGLAGPIVRLSFSVGSPMLSSLTSLGCWEMVSPETL